MRVTTLPPLPTGFEDLAALAAEWARPTESARNQIRWAASAADFAAFYEAFMPRLPQALDHLAAREPGAMNETDRNLFALAAAFAEAAPHHELYGGSAEVPHSFAARRFVPGHGERPSDSASF